MAEQVIIEAAPVEAGSIFGEVLVANTDTLLLAANASREAFVVSADTADIFLSYGSSAAALNKGIRVKAGGSPFREENWKGEVHVISSGAANIYGFELDLSVGPDQGEQPAGADTFVPSGPSDDYSSQAIQSAENNPAGPGQAYPPQT
jgi:hypothetical protein